MTSRSPPPREYTENTSYTELGPVYGVCVCVQWLLMGLLGRYGKG